MTRSANCVTSSRAWWNAEPRLNVYGSYPTSYCLDSTQPDALPDVLPLRTADLLRQRRHVPRLRHAAAPPGAARGTAAGARPVARAARDGAPRAARRRRAALGDPRRARIRQVGRRRRLREPLVPA